MQVVKIQSTKFLINNKIYDFVKPYYLMQKFGELINPKLKGSTLGWYIEGNWISYNQIKKSLRK